MSKRPTFVIPEGLELDLSDGNLSIRYDGDIRLEHTMGLPIGEIHAGGDLELKLEKVSGKLHSGGTLTIKGEVGAVSLHAKHVVLGRKPVKCKAISADESITIGAAKLSVDAILAPEINLDAKASGRVTVIESHNDRGATKIKGGFSINDYDDMFGNADDFLADRGLARLSGDRPPSAEPEEEEDETVEEADDTPEEEDIEDPLSLSIDDIEPLLEQAEAEANGANGANGELHDQLADALSRITSCYEGADLPPAVSELQLLVEQQDYEALRANITEVWNGLLGFHQKRGIRPHHQVTHAFNVIHGLVRD